MASNESLESWKGLPRESVKWSELLHDSIGEKIAYGVQNGYPLEIIYSGPQSGTNRRTIRPIEAIRVSGLIYIKAYCDLRQEKRTFRLDRIVAARVLGGPSSYSSEMLMRNSQPPIAQIPYNQQNNTNIPGTFSGEIASKKSKSQLTSNPLFWIVLAAGLMIFYLWSNKDTHTQKPMISSPPQKPYSISPYPKSDIESPTIITPPPDKKSSQHLASLPTPKQSVEKPVPKIKPQYKPIEPEIKSELAPIQPKPLKQYFTVGSTKDEVLAIQGTPTSISDHQWQYGLSSIKFREGRVDSWYISPLNPLKIKMIPTQKTSKEFFTIGSTKDEVLAIQGTPTSISDHQWQYGLSSIKFQEGRVNSWYISPLNLLKIKIIPTQKTSKEFFTVGSTKDEVLAIQGTPTSISDHQWQYGLSSIKFREGRVDSWYISPLNPLKIKMITTKNP